MPILPNNPAQPAAVLAFVIFQSPSLCKLLTALCQYSMLSNCRLTTHPTYFIQNYFSPSPATTARWTTFS
jgi:hypothetical protein